LLVSLWWCVSFNDYIVLLGYELCSHEWLIVQSDAEVLPQWMHSGAAGVSMAAASQVAWYRWPYVHMLLCCFSILFLWQAEWDGSTSNKLHSVKPSLRYCNFVHLNHWDAVILRRLRIGHTRLTHQYLLRREEPPQWPSCNCALTVVDIILECQQYNSVRQKYFSVPTLKELFDTDRVNFDDILSFLRDIHLYSSI